MPVIEMPRRDPQRSKKIDRYGELCRLEDQFAPLAEEKELLGKEIQSWYKDADPNCGHVADGDLYQVQLGARANDRTITKPMKAFGLLKKQLGLASTIALLKIPLGEAIDKFIPKSEHKLFLVEERVGSRRMKVVAKQPPAPAEYEEAA